MSEDYGKRIKRAANLMSRSMDAYASQYGLTGTQMSIIDFLGESEDHTQRDIEMEFDIRPSTTTKSYSECRLADWFPPNGIPGTAVNASLLPRPRPRACRKRCGAI